MSDLKLQEQKGETPGRKEEGECESWGKKEERERRRQDQGGHNDVRAVTRLLSEN